jgi:hypothetical protein
MFRSFGQIHSPEPDGNGAGRDNDHSMAIVAEPDRSLNNKGENRENGLVSLLIDNRARSFLFFLAMISVSLEPLNTPILMTIVRCLDRLMTTSVLRSCSITTVCCPRRFYTPHLPIFTPCVYIVGSPESSQFCPQNNAQLRTPPSGGTTEHRAWVPRKFR